MTDLKSARILAIESSCDETACAILENGRALLSSVVASQMEIHARYGGVFPEVASRQHVLSITPVVEQALAQAHLTLKDIDALAVTQGPGLAGSLGGGHEHGQRTRAWHGSAAGGRQSFGGTSLFGMGLQLR